MANLNETPIWEDGVFQLEKTTPPLGGAPAFNGSNPSAGHANVQALQLANRTSWLYENREVKLANYTALRNYSGAAESVFITQSELAGTFIRLSSSSLQDNGGTIIVDTLNRVWFRVYDFDIPVSWFGVKVGDNTPATALENALSINRALDFVGSAFPGRVLLGRGTTWVTNTNPNPTAHWDNRRAIYMRYDGIPFAGQGIGKSILKLIDGADCTVIKIGSYVEETVVATRCRISAMQIDGSRATQTTPTNTENHFSGIAVSNNCSSTILEDLYVTDTPYYGIGIGQDGLGFCKVIRVETNRTGGDGLDWKNNSNNQTGGIIEWFRARNFGLLPLSNVLTPQAGLDLRSGVRAYNIDISEMTGESGLVGIRIQVGTAGETLAQPSSVEGFKVVGSSASNSQALRLIGRGSVARAGYVSGCTDGVSASNLDINLSDITSESNAVGFRFWGVDPIEADTGSHKGLMARSNTQAGFIFDSVDEVTLIGCDARNNALGIDIRTGSTNIRYLGGSCSGNTTQLSDLGSGTIIQNVSGLRTRQRVTASVPIDSTGIKNITVNHTLGVTPNINDVQLQMRRGSNVGDWEPGALNLTNDPTSTQIFAQLRVITASATAGATVNVDLDIQSKCTM